MAKKEARRKGGLIMDLESDAFPSLCSPLPETPLNSPSPKKVRTETSKKGAENVSNADILKAIHGLNDRFSKFEEMVNKNTAEIVVMQENMKDLGMQCKATDDIVKKLNERVTAMLRDIADDGTSVCLISRNTATKIVGRNKDDNKPRPIIMQFTMRAFRHKVWRASLNSDVLKGKNLRIAEDLTYMERWLNKPETKGRRPNGSARWQSLMV
ncbi:unnamed protein product [Leuciscus chuanchicus]